MEVKTYPGAKLRKGYKISFDKLTHEQLEALHKELETNQSMGVIGDAPLDSVLHSLLTLQKKGGGSRWVITCITANDITVDYWWHQPYNATSLQQRMLGAKYFWLADLAKGYWQVQLHENSRWLYCFATPWGPKQYLRAPMGGKATAPHFDMCCHRVLDSAGLLHKGVEMIHDDHTGHASVIYDEDPDGRSHYHLLRRYLKMCAQHRLRISPKKFVLFCKTPDVGGHLHGGGGFKPSPPRYQAIVEQKEPTTLDHLYTGIGAVGWSRTFIPNFAMLERPIRAFVMKKLGSGRKTIQRAKHIKLKDCPEWNDDLKKAYVRLKYALIMAIKRAYRDVNKIVCLLWDANKFGWSYTITTQVAPEELAKPWSEQQHEILVTRSGLFKGRQLDWHAGCKEGFPPTRAIEVDAQYLAGRFPFIAAGDHENITYIMNKDKRPQVLKRTSIDRLNRWCLKWAHQNFQIYHVPGVMNTFNDFHTRNGAPDAGPFFTLKDHERQILDKLEKMKTVAEGDDPVDEEHACELDACVAHVKQNLLITEPMPIATTDMGPTEVNLAGQSLLPNLDPFNWPGPKQIAEDQKQIPAQARATLRSVDTAIPDVALLTNNDGKIVLPKQASQLIACICAAAHLGKHNHVKHGVMRRTIAKAFWWPGMNADIEWWAKHCLLCIKLAGGKLIPRPLGYQLRATQPMEVVAIDFMDMPKSAKRFGFKCLLVIVDQLTRICIMVPSKDKKAITAARILIERWLSFFPDPAFLVSDGGTHLKNKLFKAIAEIRGFQHHITAPYSQWGNGGVERLNQEIIKAIKTVVASTDTEIPE